MQILPIDFIVKYNPGTKIFDLLAAFNLSRNWVAGGAIRRTILNQPLDSDIDVFFKSEEELMAKVKEYNEKFPAAKYREGLNNIQFTIKHEGSEYVIQFIRHYHATIDELLNSFDYTLCQFCIMDDVLYCGDSSLFDIGRKRIVVNKITFPVASLRRLLKYVDQGFYACTGALTDVLSGSSELVKQNPQILTDERHYYID